MIEVLKQSAEDVSKAYDVLAFAHTERALELLAKTRTSLRQVIKELESQEPLGYIASMALNDLRDGIYGEVRVYSEELGGSVPIYTHPPQRTWVGLTDDEATEVYAETQEKVNEHWESGGTTMMFPPTLYKAIEAKFKERNNA
jgi:hypothetical protein